MQSSKVSQHFGATALGPAFLLGLLFQPEDKSDTFFRNIA
jgi:hypothetical protein